MTEFLGVATGIGAMFIGWLTFSKKQEKEATDKLEERIKALETKMDLMQKEREAMLVELTDVKAENKQLKEKIKEIEEYEQLN
jgi:septal ring factor EnvC (AmiA/AmiB activator)